MGRKEIGRDQGQAMGSAARTRGTRQISIYLEGVGSPRRQTKMRIQNYDAGILG
jgi:hypothetical protein